jgi:hypothetical protein
VAIIQVDRVSSGDAACTNEADSQEYHRAVSPVTKILKSNVSRKEEEEKSYPCVTVGRRSLYAVHLTTAPRRRMVKAEDP